MNNDIIERFELVKNRLLEIPDEINHMTPSYDSFYLEFFNSTAGYLNNVLSCINEVRPENVYDIAIDKLQERDQKFYGEIISDNYLNSYTNPDVADEKLGIYGPYLSFIFAEIMNIPVYLSSNIWEETGFNKGLFETVVIIELFLYVYGLFSDGQKPKISEVEDAVFYYAFDYIEEFAASRISECTFPNETGTAYEIIKNADLSDVRYLYLYGDHISDTEIKLSQYLSSLSDDEIDSIAYSFTDGFRRGFDVMGVDFTGKKYVNIRYHLGQERIVRAAVKQFNEMGLVPVLNKSTCSRLVKKGVIKSGYESTSPNLQFEYDHRLDDRLFLDGRYMKRRLDAAENFYKHNETEIKGFAGPAVIESFGEILFTPVVKETVEEYTPEQRKLFAAMYNELGEISNKYLPGDSYSFTIIAFPLPDIGDNFEEIFDETVKINTLDNAKYIKIQQCIIDVLDKADCVRVQGMNGNKTDIRVQMRKLSDPEKETQFENCTADVNIPLGEVFTSPVLKGTNGLLNVKSSYINGYRFKNLSIEFKDGVISDYSCDHEDGYDAGRRYIKENIMFNHDSLPVGEFAIGTNTTAYSMGRKFNIIDKLPILIVEKTGPHFAVGDTCYSHAEDHPVYNPDGKEIISRENEISALRHTDPSKAYFNCHTDITIPYNELGRLWVVDLEGNETDIIVNGKFVLPGTDQLNDALEN